jgi:hypothetical protein
VLCEAKQTVACVAPDDGMYCNETDQTRCWSAFFTPNYVPVTPCPADSWSCLAFNADNDTARTSPVLDFTAGCHYPKQSPLYLTINGAQVSPKAKEDLVEQCMHPPNLYPISHSVPRTVNAPGLGPPTRYAVCSRIGETPDSYRQVLPPGDDLSTELLKWYKQCSEIFFNANNGIYDWTAVVQGCVNRDDCQQKPSFDFAFGYLATNVLWPAQIYLNDTLSKLSIGTQNDTIKKLSNARTKMEQLAAALSIADMETGNGGEQGSTNKAKLHTMSNNVDAIVSLFGAHIAKTGSLNAESTLTIPSESVGFYTDKLNTYLGVNTNQPNSLYALSLKFDADKSLEQIMSTFANVFQADSAMQAEKATDLKLRLDQASQQFQLAHAAQVKAEAQMHNQTEMVNETLTKLHEKFEEWILEQLVSLVVGGLLEAATWRLNPVSEAEKGIKDLEAIGKIDKMATEAEEFAKTAEKEKDVIETGLETAKADFTTATQDVKTLEKKLEDANTAESTSKKVWETATSRTNQAQQQYRALTKDRSASPKDIINANADFQAKAKTADQAEAKYKEASKKVTDCGNDVVKAKLSKATKQAAVVSKQKEYNKAEAQNKKAKDISGLRNVIQAHQNDMTVANLKKMVPKNIGRVASFMYKVGQCFCFNSYNIPALKQPVHFSTPCVSITSATKSDAPELCKATYYFFYSFKDKVGNTNLAQKNVTSSLAASSIDEIESSLAQFDTGFWESYVAKATANVHSFLTGKTGGAEVAGLSYQYIAQTKVYAAYGKDYTNAVTRVVSSARLMHLLQSELAAEKKCQALINSDATKANSSAQFLEWDTALIATKMSNDASVIHTAVHQTCKAIAYVATERYFQCMAKPASAKQLQTPNTLQSFCGRYDLNSSNFMPFKPLVLQPGSQSVGADVSAYLNHTYNVYSNVEGMITMIKNQLFKPENTQNLVAVYQVHVLEPPSQKALQNQSIHYAQCSMDSVKLTNLTECPRPIAPSTNPPSPSMQVQGKCYISKDAYESLPTNFDPCELSSEGNKTYFLRSDNVCCQFEGNSTNSSEATNSSGPDETHMIQVSQEAWESFTDPSSVHHGKLDFTISFDPNRSQGLTAMFVVGFQAFLRHAITTNHEIIEVTLRPAAGASMTVPYCIGGSTSCLGNEKPLTFMPASGNNTNGHSFIDNPFGKFEYSNPKQDQPVCGHTRQLTDVFSHSPQGNICNKTAEGCGNTTSPPKFCVNSQYGSHQALSEYFFPSSSNEDKFFQSSGSFVLPTFYTDWSLEFVTAGSLDLTNVKRNDLFLAFYVQAASSDSDPTCCIDATCQQKSG